MGSDFSTVCIRGLEVKAEEKNHNRLLFVYNIIYKIIFIFSMQEHMY